MTAQRPLVAVPNWREIDLERVRHMTIGDLLDAYAIAGIEVRVQVAS